MDRIIAEAGTAKMTLYRNFASKDDLIVAFLARARGALDARAGCRPRSSARADDAGASGCWRSSTSSASGSRCADFEGCSFINVMLELTTARTPARAASVRHLSVIREFLAGLAAEAGVADPDAFARQWHILMKGSIVAAAEGDTQAAARAQELGALLLAARGVRSAPDSFRRERQVRLTHSQGGERMAIPTELVGSLPRPMKLQEAYEAYDQGKIEWAELQAEQDAAAEDSIRRLEEVGEPIVTDGEQRESSFATYPITDTLAGTGLADNLAGDGQFFAIFDDGHHRQLPRLTGGPFRYKTFASEFVEKNRAIATHPVKQAVIAPSMLMLLYPLEGEIEGYSRDQFLADLCDEVEKDIRSASTPAPCASRSTSPRAGWRTRTTRATPGPTRTCSRSSSTSTTA